MRVQSSIEGQVVHVRMEGGRRVATLAVNDVNGPTSIQMIIPDGCPDVHGRRIRADRYAHLGGGLYDCEWVAPYGRPRRRFSRRLVLVGVLVVLTLAVQMRRVFESPAVEPAGSAASSNQGGSGPSEGVGVLRGTGEQRPGGIEKKTQVVRKPSGKSSTPAAQPARASAQVASTTTPFSKPLITPEGREIIPAPPPHVSVSESPLIHQR